MKEAENAGCAELRGVETVGFVSPVRSAGAASLRVLVPGTLGTMRVSQLLILLGLVVVLGVPFALRPAARGGPGSGDALTLVVITPHVPQIRDEFAAGFDRWHRRVYGRAVKIDWRVPGGTSEILKQLESQYVAATKNFQLDFTDPRNPKAAPGTIPEDLVFGGGSYDHGRLKRGIMMNMNVVTAEKIEARPVQIPMSEPAGFSRERLDAWFGENRIGAQKLYDPEQFWIGTALSGFGIVYNRDVLARLGLPEPERFEDLTSAGYVHQLDLADPRQSGSVATAMDSILNRALFDEAERAGWSEELAAALSAKGPWEPRVMDAHGPGVQRGFERGWRLLREMSANARTFTNSSTKPPIDVSEGEAAAGLAIDFYGRGQAQAVLAPGQDPREGRVGYVDPKGTVYIDADPVSILRGGPHPELARRFVEFVLSEEGQALWQFHAAGSPAGAGNPRGPDGLPMGPAREELRRMPVRRVMYEKYGGFMIDKANPFELASRTLAAGWRTAIAPMMGAFAIDTAHEQREAWRAIQRARGDAAFPRDRLEQMEDLFFAWPPTPVDGKSLAFTAANYPAIRAEWAKDPSPLPRLAISYTRFFKRSYERVVDLGRAAD